MLSNLRRLLHWGRIGHSSTPELDVEARLLEAIRNPPDWTCPPANPQDADAWDRYWSEHIAHGIGPPLFDMCFDDHELVTTMNDEGMRRILCAGNGISQEPWALAAAGFEVVALDLSPRATEIARSAKLAPEGLQHFLVNPEMLRLGGHVDFVVGDIRDSTVCPGPFDVIIERITLRSFYS